MAGSPGRSALVDYHVHTARCGHAVGAMERYVERGIETGLAEMGFSDHLYMYWLPTDKRDPELAMAEWELEAYVRDVERCRERYRSDITIRLSTEADFIPGHESDLERVLGRYDWDYVIGSVHFVDGWGLDDSRFLQTYDEWDIDALYRRYFDLMAQTAESGLFDIVGHLDLVKKFGHRPRENQLDAYHRLAKRLAVANVCAEVNTSGLRKPCAEIYPHADLLRACRETGVSVTLGSDAHAPGDVAADFLAATRTLHASGYDSYVAFTSRQRESRPLAVTDEPD